jgi:hypothetical protein
MNSSFLSIISIIKKEVFIVIIKEVSIWEREMIPRAGVEMTVAARTIFAGLQSARTRN